MRRYGMAVILTLLWIALAGYLLPQSTTYINSRGFLVDNSGFAIANTSAGAVSPTSTNSVTGLEVDSNGALILSPQSTLSATRPTFNIPTPGTGNSGEYQAYYSASVSITKVACSTDGLGTVSVNLEIRPESAPNSTGTTVLTSPLVCTGSNATTTTILNGIIPASGTAGYYLALMITATTGSPGVVRVGVVTQ